MEITITKTITENVKINVNDLKVFRTNSRDVDSTNLVVCYNDTKIGHGYINDITNWAHILLYIDNQELEDYLIDAIENKKININN
jgi:hypothetical protein